MNNTKLNILINGWGKHIRTTYSKDLDYSKGNIQNPAGDKYSAFITAMNNTPPMTVPSNFVTIPNYPLYLQVNNLINNFGNNPPPTPPN